MSTARRQPVAAAAVTELPTDPKTEMRILFRREAALEGQLREVREALASARRRYADEEGLITPPRIERLRQEFGQ